MNFLTNINLTQNQIQNAVIHPLTNAPAGVEGQVYYNSVTKHLYIHNGTDWTEVGSGYSLPISSATVLGGVKVGSGLAIDGAGVLSTVLQTVKINGSSLVISSNAVDILIGVGTSNGQIKVNGSDITIYTHPTYTAADTSSSVTPGYADTFTVVDGVTRTNGHVTGINVKTVTMPTAYVHPNHTGDVTSTGDGATVIGTNKVTLAKMAQIATASFLGRSTAATGNVEVLSATTVRSILNVADGANNYVHPAEHAISVITGLQTALDGKVDDAQVLTNVPAGALFTDTVYVHPTTAGNKHIPSGGAANQVLKYSADGTAVWGTDADTIYTHPTTDGNLHVPATSTTNNGKVLTAGATAGSLSWVTPTVYEAVVSLGTANQIWGMNNAANAKEWKSFGAIGTSGTAPAWSLATANTITLNIPMASTGLVTAGLLSNTDYGKIHTQNTDTGTSSATFTIGTSGVKIKNSGGTELQIRNNGDTAYADLRVNNLVVEGTTTTINSNTVDIGDSNITLNSDIATSAANSNGGISVKRLMANNTTRKDAVLEYNISTDKWQTTFGAVADTLVTLPLANKYTTTLGNAVDTSFVVTHNLNSRDVVVTIRETDDDYEVVYTDVKVTTANTATVSFATAPTAAQYTITIVG